MIELDFTSLKVAKYLRKSLDAEDRQIQSIESQNHIVAPLILEKGLRIARSFGEKMTAKEPGRPFFDELVGLIESGEIDCILCWKPNRLARNPIDGGRIIWLLQTGKLKAIITPYRIYL